MSAEAWQITWFTLGVAALSTLAILPPGVALMIFITRPDYISIMFTNVIGNLMLMGGAVWMGLGILMMRKMINFKF